MFLFEGFTDFLNASDRKSLIRSVAVRNHATLMRLDEWEDGLSFLQTLTVEEKCELLKYRFKSSYIHHHVEMSEYKVTYDGEKRMRWCIHGRFKLGRQWFHLLSFPVDEEVILYYPELGNCGWPTVYLSFKGVHPMHQRSLDGIVLSGEPLISFFTGTAADLRKQFKEAGL